MTRIAAVLAFAAVLPVSAFAAPPAPKPSAAAAVPSGTLSICNASGARAITGSLTFTLAAAASAGGTQTINVAVGTCSTPIFYPIPTAVTITENVPTGYAVTAVAITSGTATLSSSTPAGGTAVAVVGSGASAVTFTTSGPAVVSVPKDCKVPNVLGLGLTGAKAALITAHCALGRVRRAYSSGFRVGRVMATLPRRGALLAPHAPVDVVLSRGPRP